MSISTSKNNSFCHLTLTIVFLFCFFFHPKVHGIDSENVLRERKQKKQKKQKEREEEEEIRSIPFNISEAEEWLLLLLLLSASAGFENYE